MPIEGEYRFFGIPIKRADTHVGRVYKQTDIMFRNPDRSFTRPRFIRIKFDIVSADWLRVKGNDNKELASLYKEEISGRLLTFIPGLYLHLRWREAQE